MWGHWTRILLEKPCKIRYKTDKRVQKSKVLPQLMFKREKTPTVTQKQNLPQS